MSLCRSFWMLVDALIQIDVNFVKPFDHREKAGGNKLKACPNLGQNTLLHNGANLNTYVYVQNANRKGINNTENSNDYR